MTTLPEITMGDFHLSDVRVEMKPWNVGVQFVPQGSLQVHLAVSAAVRTNVVTGGPESNRLQAAHVKIVSSWAELRARVREIVVETVTHEVDEWLRSNGVRISNPHPGGLLAPVYPWEEHTDPPWPVLASEPASKSKAAKRPRARRTAGASGRTRGSGSARAGGPAAG